MLHRRELNKEYTLKTHTLLGKQDLYSDTVSEINGIVDLSLIRMRNMRNKMTLVLLGVTK